MIVLWMLELMSSDEGRGGGEGPPRNSSKVGYNYNYGSLISGRPTVGQSSSCLCKNMVFHHLSGLGGYLSCTNSLIPVSTIQEVACLITKEQKFFIYVVTPCLLANHFLLVQYRKWFVTSPEHNNLVTACWTVESCYKPRMRTCDIEKSLSKPVCIQGNAYE